MKKTYETMEAYKVSFNANEQIAAAACLSYEINGRYGNNDMVEPACVVDIVDGKYMTADGQDLSTYGFWGTPGGENDGVRYA